MFQAEEGYRGKALRPKETRIFKGETESKHSCNKVMLRESESEILEGKLGRPNRGL